MTTRRIATLVSTLLLCTAAQAQQAPTPASSMPLIDVPSAIRTQPLSSGEVTIKPNWSARAANPA